MHNRTRLNHFCGLFLALVFSSSALAAPSGQIINVNQDYQIAFTDLGSSVLRQGDVVKVFLTADDFIYMQVVESSSILSKLGPVQLEQYKTSYRDLNRLAVGNSVKKIDPAVEKTAPPAPAVKAAAAAPVTPVQAQPAPPAVVDNSQELQRLSKDLESAKAEIVRLQESNQSLKAQVNDLTVKGQVQPSEDVKQLKATLAQLKMRLENMNRMVSEK